MGKVDNFFIDLDNRDAVYFPGQNVSGRVNLDLSKDTKIKSIKVSLHGNAAVCWSESVGDSESQHTETFKSKEEYFNVNMDVLSGSSDTVQPQGHNTYPFIIKLPDVAPASYESIIGQVRWQVFAYIDIPWSFNKQTKRIITIVNQLDLNTLGPTMMNGDEQTDSKTLCCLCCESDPYSATVKIYRRGYVPGETITFSAEVNNLSSRDMKFTKAQLQMLMCYYAEGTYHYATNVVFETIRDVKIPKGETDVWMNGKLPIPPVPPSYLTGCTIIDIKYLVAIVVVPNGIGMELQVPVEVVIGTVPLSNIVGQYGMATSSALPPPYPAVPSAPPGAPSGLYTDTSTSSSFPQPQFAPSAFGMVSVNEKDTSGDTQYAPKYAYYNYDRPTPSETFDIVGKK